MAKLYELRVAEGHRYDWLPIRLKNGKKAEVGKDKVTVLGSDDLAPGEEFTILRYQEEGRMVVVEVEPGAEEEEITLGAEEPKRTHGKRK